MRRHNVRRQQWELSRVLFHSLQQRRVLTGTIDTIIKFCNIEDPPGRVAKFLQRAESMPSVPFMVKRKLVHITRYPQVFYTIRLKDDWAKSDRVLKANSAKYL
jgi:hypothetical protein